MHQLGTGGSAHDQPLNFWAGFGTIGLSAPLQDPDMFIKEHQECHEMSEEKSQKDLVVTASKPSKYTTAYIITMSPLQR